MDRILDTYLERDVRPYVEIGSMPKALSRTPEPYQHEWRPGLPYDDIYTGRSRLRPRGVIPRISAARSQLCSLFIARSSTSLICIARSKAEGGKSMDTPGVPHTPSRPGCKKRTFHLLSEADRSCALHSPEEGC